MTQLAVPNQKNDVARKTSTTVKKGIAQKIDEVLQPLQYVNGNPVLLSKENQILQQAFDRRINLPGLFVMPVTGVVASYSIYVNIPETPTSWMFALLVGGGFSSLIVGLLLSEALSSFYKKSFIKAAQMYRAEIMSWLKQEHGITVSIKHFENIFNKIIYAETTNYVFEDILTGVAYQLGVNTTDNTWVITKIVFENAAHLKVLPAPEKTRDMRTDEILESVNRKTAVLKNCDLNTEDAYSLMKAVQDTHATVKLVKQLRQLGDTQHSHKAEKALKSINSELDRIIEKQKRSINAQFIS